MILHSLLRLLPLWLMGFLLVDLLWPGRLRKDLLFKLALGIGVGQGVDSCLYFFWIMAFGPSMQHLMTVEYGLCIFLTGMAALRSFSQPREDVSSGPAPLAREWVLLAGFLVLLLGSAAGFFLLTVTRPYGTFDAYAIWNLKARFMFIDPQHWQNAFSTALNWKTQPDYPLLVPLNVLRLWELLGAEVPRAGALLSASYTFGLVGLIFAAFYRLRDLGQAALAGILMLATPAVLMIGTAQTADLPLAYSMLAAALMFYLAVGEPHPGYIILSGLMGGLAAWTKNEGIVFLILLALSALGMWFKHPRRLAWMVIGLALPLAAVLVFKLQYAPPNDLMAGQSLATILPKLVDLPRYGTILGSLGQNLLTVGGWKLPILIVLLLGALLLRHQLPPQEKTVYWVFCGLVLLTLAGFCAVYVITPHPLEWHLKYSMDRLMLQIFPMLLCLLLLGMRTPREWGRE